MFPSPPFRCGTCGCRCDLYQKRSHVEKKKKKQVRGARSQTATTAILQINNNFGHTSSSVWTQRNMYLACQVFKIRVKHKGT